MIRKLATALILVPAGIVLIALAVANRQRVVLSFDPFDAAHPALTGSLPLFALMLALILGGVILGGAAAWLRQAKWRWRARRFEAEVRRLRAENERLRLRAGAAAFPALSPSANEAPRLAIPPA
ncbi:MAG TPA: LapA family protein [Xanthobacteraceae bacterium]|jgi:uncharacterized integral membrane protein